MKDLFFGFCALVVLIVTMDAVFAPGLVEFILGKIVDVVNLLVG